MRKAFKPSLRVVASLDATPSCANLKRVSRPKAKKHSRDNKATRVQIAGGAGGSPHETPCRDPYRDLPNAGLAGDLYPRDGAPVGDLSRRDAEPAMPVLSYEDNEIMEFFGGVQEFMRYVPDKALWRDGFWKLLQAIVEICPALNAREPCAPARRRRHDHTLDDAPRGLEQFLWPLLPDDGPEPLSILGTSCAPAKARTTSLKP